MSEGFLKTAEGNEMSDSPSTRFEQETLQVLAGLRGALAEAMTMIPGGVQKSQDIQKRFGLSFTLSWQVYRIMRAERPLEISPHIPTAKSMKKLLGALRENGGDARLVTAVEEAYARFQKHVESFSGDRTGFEAMTLRMGGGVADEQIEQTHRRQLFELHRYLLGVEQDVYVNTTLMHPEKGDRSRFVTAHFRMRQNLRRLRSDIPVVVDTAGTHASRDLQPVQRVPLDAEAFERYGFYLLPEYCSQEELPLVQKVMPNGLIVTKWLSDEVGRTSAIDFAVGMLNPGMVMKPTPGEVWHRSIMTLVSTPTRKFVQDVIVHRSFGPVEFELNRWGYVVEPPPPHVSPEELEVPRFPCNEKLAFMGTLDGGALAEVPQYLSMLRKYAERFGWDIADLRLYRLRVDYPILHVLQRIMCYFPKAGE